MLIPSVRKLICFCTLLLCFATANGQKAVWLKSFGGFSDDLASAVAVDSATGDIYYGLYHFSSLFVNSVGYSIAGQYDAMLIKMDSSGNVLWVKRVASNTSERISSIAVGPNGDIAVTGWLGTATNVNFFDSSITTSGQACNFVARLSSAGKVKWFHTGGKSTNIMSGNTVCFEQNNIVVASYTSFPATFLTYSLTANSYVASFDSAGGIKWLNNVTGFISALHAQPGRIYIAGSFSVSITLGPLVINSTTGTDGFWAKLDGNGNYGFAKKIYTSKTDNVLTIQADASGGVFIGGTSNGDTLFCDTKAALFSIPNSNALKSFLTYFDKLGNYRWIRSMQSLSPGLYATGIKSATITTDGHQLIIGGSITKPTSVCTYVFGNIMRTFQDALQNKMFVCKVDTEGTFAWALTTGNAAGVINYVYVGTDKRKNVYYASATSGPTQFNQFSMAPIALYDGVLLKISEASITRSPLSKTSYCGGDSMYIPYTAYGTFAPGNTFFAQLSDTAGNFTGPSIPLGQLKTNSSGVIALVLPVSILQSSKYRIRIMSDSQQTFSDALNQSYSIASTPVTNAGADQTICSGQSAALVGSGPGGNIYRWSPGNLVTDSNALSTTFISKINVLPGDKPYIMRLIVKNSAACADTDTVVVSVRQQLSMQVAADTTLCIGTGTCVVLKPIGGKASSYLIKWFDKNNMVLSTDDSLCLNATDTGFYRATLTDQCSNNSPFQMVHVHRHPPLSVTLVKPPLLVCKDDKLTFKASASGGNKRYIFQWYNPADSTVVLGTDSVLKIQITNPISLRCKITDGCTAQPVWTMQADVLFKPPLSISIGGNLTLPAGTPHKMVSQITPSPASGHKVYWYWRGLYAGAGDSINLVPDSSGTLQAVLYDSCMKTFDTAGIYITVRLHIKILNGADTSICTGGTASFFLSAIAPDTGNVVFTWDNGLGTGRSKTVTPPGTTTYTVIATDGFNLADTLKIKVTILAPLQITGLQNITICDGQSMNILAGATGGSKNYTFAWTDGFTGPARSIPSPDSNLTYEVTVNDGCSPPVSKTFKAIKEPLPVLNLVVSPDRACPPLIASLRNTTTNNPAYSYQYFWDFGDGQIEISATDSTVHSYTQSGNYLAQVTIKSALGCSNKSAPVPLTVTPKPEVAFETDPGEAPVTNPEITFTPNCQHADSLRWYFGDGDSSFAFSEVKHIYPDTGHYKVWLIAKNVFGCTDSIERGVKILQDYAAWIPNAFSPDGDTLNATFHPYGIGIREYTMAIYNRWGQLMFKNTGKTDAWNGGIGNDIHRPADEGLYVYYIGLRNYHGRGHSFRGTVYLTRH